MTNTNTTNNSNYTSLIIDYLQSKAIKLHSYSGLTEKEFNEIPLFYVNVMNNKEATFLQDNSNVDYKNIYVRDMHNFCNITFIDYTQDQNGYKLFGERKWFYVVNQNSEDSFTLRDDLIQKWEQSNAKDSVIIVNTSNCEIHEISMQDIIYRHINKDFICSVNSDGNIIDTFKFDTKPEMYNHYELKDSKTYLEQSWSFIGNCKYAAYRKSNPVLVACYNEEGKLENKLTMKSLTQVYKVFNFKNISSLRTFQRMFKTDSIVAMFLTSESGKVYYISTEPTITVPETTETITTGVVDITIVDEERDIVISETKAIVDNRENKTEDTEIIEMVNEVFSENKVVEKITDYSAEVFIDWNEWTSDWKSWIEYKKKFYENN